MFIQKVLITLENVQVKKERKVVDGHAIQVNGDIDNVLDRMKIVRILLIRQYQTSNCKHQEKDSMIDIY